MDQAWELEQEFWTEAGQGSASRFYERHMITDGYVVLPSGVVSRRMRFSWVKLSNSASMGRSLSKDVLAN